MSKEFEILQNVIMVVLQVAIPPLLAWGLSELKKYLDQLRQSKNWEHVEWAVQTAVQAAEQLGLTDQLSEYGEERWSGTK